MEQGPIIRFLESARIGGAALIVLGALGAAIDVGSYDIWFLKRPELLIMIGTVVGAFGIIARIARS